jgi:hypothetical protein
VRHHFVVAPGHLFCLSFGTTAIAEDAPLLDELAARFELVGDPPGATPAAGGGDDDESIRPRPAIRIDEALRRRAGPYSTRARRVLVAAHEEAIGRRAAAVDEEHLLAGVAAVEGSAGLAILDRLGGSRERLRQALESILPPVPPAADQGAAGAEPEVVSLPLGERLEPTLTLAEEEARSLGLDYVGVEHLVLALLRPGTGPAHELVSRLGVPADAVRAVLRKHLDTQHAAQSR